MQTPPVIIFSSLRLQDVGNFTLLELLVDLDISIIMSIIYASDNIWENLAFYSALLISNINIIRGVDRRKLSSRSTHLLHNSLKAPFQVIGKVLGDYYNKVRLYSTNLTTHINPWFITGFVDAEGSFILKISKSLKYKAGWKVEPVFSIGLHQKDWRILEQIQTYWGGIGRINRTNNVVSLTISARKDLAIVLAHFGKYPLITQKKADFELFKLAFEIINQGEYSQSLAGIQSIINIRASLLI
uniref:Homing endonuclease LAGLIDADG domain-containing protein n=1 Tax=Dactylella sp. TaxID=1814903 RepID=A0A482DTF4_9PEZI|nr:hypothetical protein [Dactylella sp.]